MYHEDEYPVHSNSESDKAIFLQIVISLLALVGGAMILSTFDGLIELVALAILALFWNKAFMSLSKSSPDH